MSHSQSHGNKHRHKGVAIKTLMRRGNAKAKIQRQIRYVMLRHEAAAAAAAADEDDGYVDVPGFEADEEDIDVDVAAFQAVAYKLVNDNDKEAVPAIARKGKGKDKREEHKDAITAAVASMVTAAAAAAAAANVKAKHNAQPEIAPPQGSAASLADCFGTDMVDSEPTEEPPPKKKAKTESSSSPPKKKDNKTQALDIRKKNANKMQTSDVAKKKANKSKSLATTTKKKEDESSSSIMKLLFEGQPKEELGEGTTCPPGWTKKVYLPQSGKSRGSKDAYWFSPIDQIHPRGRSRGS